MVRERPGTGVILVKLTRYYISGVDGYGQLMNAGSVGSLIFN